MPVGPGFRIGFFAGFLENKLKMIAETLLDRTSETNGSSPRVVTTTLGASIPLGLRNRARVGQITLYLPCVASIYRRRLRASRFSRANLTLTFWRSRSNDFYIFLLLEKIEFDGHCWMLLSEDIIIVKLE